MRKLIALVFSYSLNGIVADVGAEYRLTVLPPASSLVFPGRAGQAQRGCHGCGQRDD